MSNQNQNSPPWVAILVAIIGAVALILAAVITSSQFRQTPTAIDKVLTLEVPSVPCEGSGDLSLLPRSPQTGCVLIVEWDIPTNGQCGILFTQDEPSIATEAIGTWWYVYPNRPDSHLTAYKQKYPHCEVKDLR